MRLNCFPTWLGMRRNSTVLGCWSHHRATLQSQNAKKKRRMKPFQGSLPGGVKGKHFWVTVRMRGGDRAGSASHFSWGGFVAEEQALDMKYEGILIILGYRDLALFQWPAMALTKFVQGFRNKNNAPGLRLWWSIHTKMQEKKYLQKMPSWPMKTKLGKESGMRRELPLLVASVFSIRLGLSTPIYSTGRRTKLAL